jgi:hypothetical protein
MVWVINFLWIHLRGFVDAIKPESSTLYSSPNRITEEKETRRLSFNSGPYDFFEYYWAHFIDEPGIVEILKWSAKLLFLKRPSERLKPHIKSIRFIVICLLLLIGGLGFLGYKILDDYNNRVSFTFIGTVLFILFKLTAKIISGTVVGRINNSLGDVIKYTVPSPHNIATREKIRKNGIELIKNLHEAKKEDGVFKYSKIIVIGHSLGTVVAYDILTSLFAQYHRKYSGIPPHEIKQEVLEKIRGFSPDCS